MGGQGDSDDALEAELTEFEAALKKHVEESKLTPHVEEPLPEPHAPHLPTDEEIEARLSRAIKDAESYLGPEKSDANDVGSDLDEDKVHAEFSDRVRQVDARLDKIQDAKRADQEMKSKRQSSEGEAARGLGAGLSAAYAIIGCPLLGAGIGFLIDRGLGTQSGIAIGTVVGAGIGMVGAITILNRFGGQ